MITVQQKRRISTLLLSLKIIYIAGEKVKKSPLQSGKVMLI